MGAVRAEGGHDPARVMADLLAGNRRFLRDDLRHDRPRPRRGRDRSPFVAVLGCMDGRVPLDAAFDQDVGAICAIRSGGPVLDRAVLGSVELAVTALHVDAVLVLGHTRCAAVAAAVEAVRSGRRSGGAADHVIDEIIPAVREAGPDPSADDVVPVHVRRTVAQLRRSVTLPAGGAAAVAGAVYDLDTGRVTLLDGSEPAGS